MIERIVVDTDIIVDHLRNVGKATSFLKDVETKKYKAFIFTITEAELFSGTKLTPEESEAYLNKGVACEEAGWIKEAIGDYKGFIQYAPPQYASYLEQARQKIRQLER